MKYTKLLVLIFLIFQVCNSVFSQQRENEIDTTSTYYYFIEGDSISRKSIDLKEVYILSKLKFDDNIERRRYLILRRKTRKVYPYAKLAADRLTNLNKRIETIKSKRKKKKYIKQVQKYVEEEFTAELKKLSKTEGQILVKLVHRQTGITMFSLIKDYRSGWRAFWYNNTAKLFNISLKREYDPINDHEDYLIEDILQRSFQDGILKEQETALDFDFGELTNKWKN